MTGIYQHTLDAKGRLFIPAKLREELGDTFYVTVSPEKCLSAYSQENWKGISEKAAAMSNVQQRKVRPLFAYAARCELDGQGRILLPQHLREFAGLTKSVTVVGSNNHAEFWDSARWDEICPLEALPENIAAGSKSIPSTASMPRRSRMAAVSRKLPCTSCTRSPNGASRAPARAIAVSSRSMPMSVPVVRRPAICSEWPPIPSVPST